jgi:hypothetical protein
LPVSTVSRLLAALEQAGFLRRTACGFVCGTQLMRIGLCALQNVSAYDVAEPHLAKLTSMDGESSYLGIPAEGGQIVYIRQSLSRGRSATHLARAQRSRERDCHRCGDRWDTSSPMCLCGERAQALEPGRFYGDCRILSVGPNAQIRSAAVNMSHWTHRTGYRTRTSRGLGVFGRGLTGRADSLEMLAAAPSLQRDLMQHPLER